MHFKRLQPKLTLNACKQAHTIKSWVSTREGFRKKGNLSLTFIRGVGEFTNIRCIRGSNKNFIQLLPGLDWLHVSSQLEEQHQEHRLQDKGHHGGKVEEPCPVGCVFK